jgi:hypothetical protein
MLRFIPAGEPFFCQEALSHERIRSGMTFDCAGLRRTASDTFFSSW